MTKTKAAKARLAARKKNAAPQETAAGGKNLVAIAAMAPILAPVIAGAVSQVIGAIRGNGSASTAGSALRVRRGSPKGELGASMARQTAGPGNNPSPPQRVSYEVVSSSRRGVRVRFRDEVGTVTIPATSYGTALAAGGLTNTPLMPVSTTVHPTNNTEGQFYMNWRAVSVKLSFVPTAGDTQSGTILLGYVDTPQSAAANDAVSTEVKAMANPFMKMIPANKAGEILIQGVSSWTEDFEIGTSGAADQRDVTPGCIACYASALDGSTHAVGKLFIESVYELYDRRSPFNGAGLAMSLYNQAGRATTDEEKARVRAKLADLVDLLVSSICGRLQRPVEAVDPGISEADLRSRLARVSLSSTTAKRA